MNRQQRLTFRQCPFSPPSIEKGARHAGNAIVLSTTSCDWTPICTPDQARLHILLDEELLAALQEAQTVARSYDNKAQIVGVGYILALNLVLRFGDLLPTHAPIRATVLCGWSGDGGPVPILQFGQVLYPSRTRAEREFNGRTSHGSKVPPVYYVDPRYFADVRDLMHQVLKSDWTSVLATELLKTSRVR